MGDRGGGHDEQRHEPGVGVVGVDVREQELSQDPLDDHVARAPGAGDEPSEHWPRGSF